MIETNTISSARNLNFGYIDLSNIENSIFLGDRRDVLGEIKNYIPQSKNKVIDNLEEKLKEYFEFEMELIEKMNMDTIFPPCPRSVKACNFCSFNKICPRGEK